MGAAVDPRTDRALGPLASARRSAWRVMVIGPLTGAGFNPARAFGPALVSGEWGGFGHFVSPYVLAPVIGARRGGARLLPPLHRPGGEGPGGTGAGRLRAGAARVVDSGAMRRVTFSRNFTLSLSRTCRCYCKYCAFATHRAHLYAPDEVERMLDDASRRGVKELLVLTGREAGGQPRGGGAAGASTGTTDFVVVRRLGMRARARARDAAPHERRRCSREELERLRQVTASQGLMLESVNPDLVVHQGSPTKHPDAAPRDDPAAGELRIPFTSGILVGIGEAPEERVQALEALAELHARARPPPGGDPPELRARTRATTARSPPRSPTRRSAPTRTARRCRCPAWATPVTLDDMRALVRESRRLMPDVGVQIPPNLSDWWLPLVEEGATDLGGLSANGDHISPEHPFPSVAQDAQAPGAAGLRAHRAPLRVPAVHGRRAGSSRACST